MPPRIRAQFDDVVSKVLPFLFYFFAPLPSHARRSRSKSRHRVPNALNRPDADLIVSASVTGNETGALMWRTGGRSGGGDGGAGGGQVMDEEK